MTATILEFIIARFRPDLDKDFVKKLAEGIITTIGAISDPDRLYAELNYILATVPIGGEK